MDERETQRGNMNNQRPANEQELILFRLDAIDKKLVDLQLLMTQTALQEQKIAELEKSMKDFSDYPLLQEKVRELIEAKKNANAKWWQVGLIALSPVITAVVMFALMGGFNGK